MADANLSPSKGRVCVTGGTGFLASWIIMKLLEQGYHVNTTIRQHITDEKRDLSYLTNLPDATERLQIFHADLDNPDSFRAPIEGCIGVFHVAHPIDFQNQETEEVITNRSIKGSLAIIQACIDSKTVKRMVYTSSAATVMFSNEDVIDETSWSDVDYMKKIDFVGTSYMISKTLTEKAAIEFAKENSFDLVSVIPTWVHGPFICPNLPGSVSSSLAFIIGNESQIRYFFSTPFVHTDDVANAHIFLFEYPEAEGRYICSALEISADKLSEFLSTRYHEYKITSADSLFDREAKFGHLSSKKLLDTGFRYKYGLEEMFDEAIECCKKRGIF